ncbi:MAG: hypothetical protein FWB72_03810, partial [Firmicutes bacterium]|nr:hypothetical protein [Bacillota bacterium]
MFLYLRQKVLAIREKFTFFNEHQMPIFRARGSFFSMPKRYELLCANTNQPLAKIRRKFWAIMPTFYIYDLTTNQQICRIKKRFRIGRPKLDIKTPAGRYTIT